MAWAQSWGWGTFLAQGGEMLGTGGRNRSQKSCGQMRKPHESELNSQTPQFSAHVQLPRASQHSRLVQAPEGTRPPPCYPRADGQGRAGVRVASVTALWTPSPCPGLLALLISPCLSPPPTCLLGLSSPPQTPQACSGSAQRGAAPSTSCPLGAPGPHLLRLQQGARKDAGSGADLVQLG